MWGERTKQDRHETPVGVRYEETGYGSLGDTTTLWDTHRPPSNQFEALMAEGETVADANQLSADWEAYDQLIVKANLSDKEQAVLEFVTFAGMSLAEAGRWLGLQFRENGKPFSKMMVSKLRDSGISKLRVVFLGETT